MLQIKITDKQYVKNKEAIFIEPLDIHMNNNDMSILIRKFIEDEWPKKMLGEKYRMLCKLMNQSIFLKGEDFVYNILLEYKDKINKEIDSNSGLNKIFITHIAKNSNHSIPELYENRNENIKEFLNEVVIKRIKCDDLFLTSRVLLLKQSFKNNVNKFKKEHDFIFKDEYLFYQDNKINLYPIFNEIMFNSGDLVFGDEETNPYIYDITRKIINFTYKNYENIEEKSLHGLLNFLQEKFFSEKEYFKDLPKIPFIYVEIQKIVNTHSKSEGFFVESALNAFLRGEKDPVGIFNAYLESKKLNEVINEQNSEQVKHKIKRI